MRKLLSVFLVLFAGTTTAQQSLTMQGNNLQTINHQSYYKFNSGLMIPILPDTTTAPNFHPSLSKVGAIGYYGGDSTLRAWTGVKWKAISGNSAVTIDTTSLSNRIDQRVKYTDTATMLDGYEATANKTNTIGAGSTTLYPTTSALIGYVQNNLASYVTTNTAQTNMSGLKSWTGFHTFNSEVTIQDTLTVNSGPIRQMTFMGADTGIVTAAPNGVYTRTNMKPGNILQKADSSIYIPYYRLDTAKTNLRNEIALAAVIPSWQQTTTVNNTTTNRIVVNTSSAGQYAANITNTNSGANSGGINVTVTNGTPVNVVSNGVNVFNVNGAGVASLGAYTGSGTNVATFNSSGVVGRSSVALSSLATADSTLWQTKYRSDTSRTAQWTAIAARVRLQDSGTVYMTPTQTKNAIDDSLDLYIPLAEKGAANGTASLGSDSKLTASQIPTLTITTTYEVNSQAAMLALSSAEQGDIALRTDLSKTFILSGSDPTVLGNWKEFLTPVAASTNLALGTNNGSTQVITNSNGTGVTLPAATTVIAGLQTAADKTKLNGIATGAEVNVNADWTAVSGDAQILNKPAIPNGTNYIENQSTINQTANFRISGSGDFRNGSNNVTVQPTGIAMSAGAIPTSAGTYDIVTRNTSTGGIEKTSTVPYTMVSGTPTIPTVNNGTLTMNTSGIATGSASFTANQSGNSTFTVNVPAETDPTVPAHVKSITTTEKSNWNTAYAQGEVFKGLIPGSSDLDAYTTTGWYMQLTNTQAASGSNYPAPYAGKLMVYNSGDGFIFQEYHAYYDFELKYYRSFYGGVWSSWSTVATRAWVNAQGFITGYNGILNQFTGSQTGASWWISGNMRSDILAGSGSRLLEATASGTIQATTIDPTTIVTSSSGNVFRVDPTGALSNASATHPNYTFFDYSWGGNAQPGPVANFSPLANSYSLELYGYYPTGGDQLWYRTFDGNAGTWNPAREVWSTKHFSTTNISNWNSAYAFTSSYSIPTLQQVRDAGSGTIARTSADVNNPHFFLTANGAGTNMYTSIWTDADGGHIQSANGTGYRSLYLNEFGGQAYYGGTAAGHEIANKAWVNAQGFLTSIPNMDAVIAASPSITATLNPRFEAGITLGGSGSAWSSGGWSNSATFPTGVAAVFGDQYSIGESGGNLYIGYAPSGAGAVGYPIIIEPAKLNIATPISTSSTITAPSTPTYSSGGYENLVWNATSGRYEKITASSEVYVGSYTPTLSNITGDVTAATMLGGSVLYWTCTKDPNSGQVLTHVTGVIHVSITGSAGIGGTGTFTISLPITPASNAIATDEDLSGVVGGNVSYQLGPNYIMGDSANELAVVYVSKISNGTMPVTIDFRFASN